ncbi:TetR/AcrR family transcriptional regulator [Halobacillus sp. BBL2006]|uniref:TetR/AcrR family transcriptional regulator n=1 Tax=Halobacillus sp. BBL2006 TaxID=1543706 RepID=UPI000541C609|nr:TetR/AcrR family transcriptional regulator [Halobacillus sp. BBL2006]KHE69044.1 TetR family transcriptional regulator [Halobacillus sp. BBL2006]
MPKKTFYNLNEEKKRILIEAAKEEFSRVSLYDASIANILKKAEIPRGSFYQYFEDKEDAFFYLLNEHAKERHENFLLHLERYEGDLFAAMTEIYQEVFEYSLDNGKINFIRNVLLNMNYKIEHTFTKHLSAKARDQRTHNIYHLVDTDTLNIHNEEEFYHVMQVVIAVTFHNLVHCVSNDFSKKEALKKYEMEINLVKAGLIK